jgi:hypothetical protein
VALTLVSIWAAIATGLTAVSMTEEVSAFGLVMLPAALVASLLARYFEWRARMIRGLRTEHDAARL